MPTLSCKVQPPPVRFAPGEAVEFWRPLRWSYGLLAAAGWHAARVAPTQPELREFLRVLSGLSDRPFVVPVACVRRVTT